MSAARAGSSTGKPQGARGAAGDTSAAVPGADRSLLGLLAAKEVAVVVGSGGVGKTSVSAAVALHTSIAFGAKVLVLTIDPARRLADALGLGGLGNIERRVPVEAIESAGLPVKGELWAAQLDTKRSWDDLVLRYAATEEDAYRILENPMYQTFASKFIQSHDYIAMERLYELHSKGEYDLIVVDTPPSRNAVDFVEAPQRVKDFIGGRLLRWVTAPYRIGGDVGAKAINWATKPFYRIADQILGSQLLEDVAEFFLSFQSMYEGFSRRADAVERLLGDDRTTFMVVTTLESAAFAEARRFYDLLESRGMPVGSIILNKVLPPFLLNAEAAGLSGRLGSDEVVARVAPAIGIPSGEERMLRRVLSTIGENFANFEAVAMMEAEEAAELRAIPGIVAKVQYSAVDVADVASLAGIGRSLFGDFEVGGPGPAATAGHESSDAAGSGRGRGATGRAPADIAKKRKRKASGA